MKRPSCAARHGKDAVSMDELDKAIDRVMAGPKKSRVMAPEERNACGLS